MPLNKETKPKGFMKHLIFAMIWPTAELISQSIVNVFIVQVVINRYAQLTVVASLKKSRIAYYIERQH